MSENKLETQEALLDPKILALIELLFNPKGAWRYYTLAAIPTAGFSKQINRGAFYSPKLVIRAFKTRKAYRALCAQADDAFWNKFAEAIMRYSLDTRHTSQYRVAKAVQNAIRENPDLIQPSSHLENLIGIFFETIKAILKCMLCYPIDVFYICTTADKMYQKTQLLPLSLHEMRGLVFLPFIIVLTMALILLKVICFFLLCPKDIFILICGAIALSVRTLIYACQDSIEACVTLAQKAYSTTVDLGVSTVSTLFSSTAKKANAEPGSCTDLAPGPS